MTRAKDISKILTDADISGNIDVDGVTNLDVVDIDGAVDMASTLQVDGNITSSGFMTITTTGNNDQITLTSTDADANSGPHLALFRNSSSPADNDFLGGIKFFGENDASEAISYATITATAIDVTDGTEDGMLAISTMVAGTTRSRIKITNDQTVINEDSIDLDFRVESDNDTHAFFLNGASGKIGLGTSSTDADLHIEPKTGNTNASLLLSNSGRTQYFRIENNESNDTLRFNANDTTQVMNIDSTGAVTMPNQPAFLVTPSNSNQTNIAVNATTTLNFGTEIFDANDDFDNTNMFFTAPITGKYQINCLFGTRSLDTASSHYIFQLSTSNRNYELQIAGANVLANDGNMYFAISQLCDMDAGDIAKMIVITASDGAQQVDINADSRFSGYLVA